MKAKDHIKELALIYGWEIGGDFDYHININNDNGIFMTIYWTKKGMFTIGLRVFSKFIWVRNVSLEMAETVLINPDKIKKIRSKANK